MKKIWWSFSVFTIMCPILTSSCNTVKMSKDTEYALATQGVYKLLRDFNKSIDLTYEVNDKNSPFTMGSLNKDGLTKIKVDDDYITTIKNDFLKKLTNKEYTSKNYDFYFLQDEDNLKKLDLELKWSKNLNLDIKSVVGASSRPFINFDYSNTTIYSSEFKKKYQIWNDTNEVIEIFQDDFHLSAFDIQEINNNIASLSVNLPVENEQYYYQKALNQLLYPYLLPYLSGWEIIQDPKDNSLWSAYWFNEKYNESYDYDGGLYFYQQNDDGTWDIIFAKPTEEQLKIKVAIDPGYSQYLNLQCDGVLVLQNPFL